MTKSAECAKQHCIRQKQQQGKETKDEYDHSTCHEQRPLLLEREMTAQGTNDTRLVQHTDSHKPQEHLGKMDRGKVWHNVTTHPTDAARREQTLHPFDIDAEHPRDQKKQEKQNDDAPIVAPQNTTDVVLIRHLFKWTSITHHRVRASQYQECAIRWLW